MITIAEPKEHIDKLWGKQRVREDAVYRLMRYVLRVDHDGKVLLHNVVTGRLVVLDQGEAEVMEKLPTAYSPVIEQLVTEHYLVPEDYDEHQQVVNLRTILRKLDDAQQSSVITHYTILPTTACNARCYYCFEQGVKPFSMTEQTANEVIAFISNHCGSDKKAFITWFGGEPTLSADRIDQISLGLRSAGIEYDSTMVSNGYLFDQDMVNRAKDLWNLMSIQISVDGTENNYNRIKAYVHADDNPYQRVIRNIGLLIEKEIHVSLRMNFDLNNYTDFKDLLEEVKGRYHSNPNLQVCAYPIIGRYVNPEGHEQHGDDAWLSSMLAELNNLARDAQMVRRGGELPFLEFRGCSAGISSFVVIGPKGTLSRCLERFGDDQITGDVRNGITNHDLFLSWQRIADYEKCAACVYYPKCVKVLNCGAGDQCYHLDRNFQYELTAKRQYDQWRR